MTISRITQAPKPLFSPLFGRYTLEEFWALPEPPDRSHYDLIGGYLFMAPPPEPPHDDLDDRLNRSLVTFLAKTGNSGRVFHPRAAIYTSDTYLEPDMMYVSADLQAKMEKRRTSADIVFEYASKSNANYDRTTNADTYLALGVNELWLLDSDSKTIEIRNAVSGDAEPTWSVRQFGHGEVASSLVLGGWQVSVDAIFSGL